MTKVEIVRDNEKMTQLEKLEIVWRNPDRENTRHRRHTLKREGKRGNYILQEFVNNGLFGHWTTICNLEVVVGGGAA